MTFCAFTVSNLLHFGARFPALGVIRIDLILAVIALSAMLLANERRPAGGGDGASRKPGLWLAILVVYIVVSLPFVEWPGSVLRFGWEPFAKAIIYFVLAVGTLKTEKRIWGMVGVYVVCQSIRVLEPLYLHITTGYWGSYAAMENWVIMDRLAGAPSDVINPNGLAFVVVTTLPLLWVRGHRSPVTWLLAVPLAVAMLYALMLTGSRSGMILLVVLFFLFVLQARSKVLAGVAACLVLALAVGSLSDLQKGRYRSIVSKEAPGASSVEGRVDGVVADLRVAMRRPLFGHGLGSSPEANYHGRGRAQISHNLITEVAQELGFIGLAIFLAFLWSGFRCGQLAAQEEGELLPRTTQSIASAMVRVLIVGAVFSLASYGLSQLYWYLWIGICVSLRRVKSVQAKAGQSARFG